MVFFSPTGPALVEPGGQYWTGSRSYVTTASGQGGGNASAALRAQMAGTGQGGGNASATDVLTLAASGQGGGAGSATATQKPIYVGGSYPYPGTFSQTSKVTTQTITWTENVPAGAACVVISGSWANPTSNSSNITGMNITAASIGGVGTLYATGFGHWFTQSSGFPTTRWDAWNFMGIVFPPPGGFPTGTQTGSITLTFSSSTDISGYLGTQYYSGVLDVGPFVTAGTGGNSSSASPHSFSVPVSDSKELVVANCGTEISGGTSHTLNPFSAPQITRLPASGGQTGGFNFVSGESESPVVPPSETFTNITSASTGYGYLGTVLSPTRFPAAAVAPYQSTTSASSVSGSFTAKAKAGDYVVVWTTVDHNTTNLAASYTRTVTCSGATVTPLGVKDVAAGHGWLEAFGFIAPVDNPTVSWTVGSGPATTFYVAEATSVNYPGAATPGTAVLNGAATGNLTSGAVSAASAKYIAHAFYDQDIGSTATGVSAYNQTQRGNDTIHNGTTAYLTLCCGDAPPGSSVTFTATNSNTNLSWTSIAIPLS